MEQLSKAFPDRKSAQEVRTDDFGIAAISRIPATSFHTFDLADEGTPAIGLRARIGAERFSVLAVHVHPLVSAENAKTREEQLDAAADWALAQKVPAVIVGDFNATPWSHFFRRLIERTGFVNSQLGFGMQASWPSDFGPLAIPIDHCLHAPTLSTQERFLGPRSRF